MGRLSDHRPDSRWGVSRPPLACRLVPSRSVSTFHLGLEGPEADPRSFCLSCRVCYSAGHTGRWIRLWLWFILPTIVTTVETQKAVAKEVQAVAVESMGSC